jgi:hypothetical protein
VCCAVGLKHPCNDKVLKALPTVALTVCVVR